MEFGPPFRPPVGKGERHGPPQDPFSFLNIQVRASTCIYSHLLASTRIYLHLPASTCIYMHLLRTSPYFRNPPCKPRQQNKATGPDRPNQSLASFRAPPLQIRFSPSRVPGRYGSRCACSEHVHPACPYMSLRVRGTPSSHLSREACFRNRTMDHAHLPLPSCPFPKRPLRTASSPPSRCIQHLT